MIKVTCAVIIDNEARILAAQRSNNMSLPLKWEFPGGKIEANETPEECLIREIKEELNISVNIIKVLPTNTHAYSDITIELIPFLCAHVKGDIILKEHIDFKWLDKNDLLALDWADADVPIVKYYISTTPHDIR